MMQEPILTIAINAARVAGNLMIRAMQRPDMYKIMEKNPNDYVTEVDQKVEQEIVKIIHKSYPSHTIIGEEGGEQGGLQNQPSEYQWIIDPIDGTRNFIHGFPHFAVSIAVMHHNRIEHGVIYDPCKQELFTASRGKGAKLNDKRIRVADRKLLKETLLGTGFAYRHAGNNHTKPGQMLSAMIPVCGDIRRAGAATLDLAYVACGRFDGFWESGLHLWDIAAGILLVKEAGGMVSDLEGGESYLKTGNIVAANPLILKQMLKVVQPIASAPQV